MILEWVAFLGSMISSILYGYQGRKGPIAGLFTSVAFIAFGLTAEIYAAVVSNIFFFAIHARNLRRAIMADTDRTKRLTTEHVKRLVDLCHGAAVKAGWWSNIDTGERIPVDVPQKLCLIHSEISEVMEAHRKDLNDDKLPHRSGVEVELADACIRIFDLAGALELDLGAAIAEKMEFNANRPDHKIKNRVKGGGKKY